jgi:hypothetical protein
VQGRAFPGLTATATPQVLDDICKGFGIPPDCAVRTGFHRPNQSLYDVRPLVVTTLLTYLELDGYLEGGTPFYANYAFQPLATSAEILANFGGERRQFLAAVFRQARKAKIWFHIDLDAAGRAAGAPRERVVRALDYLAERGLLTVKADGLRHRYRRLRAPQDVTRWPPTCTAALSSARRARSPD